MSFQQGGQGDASLTFGEVRLALPGHPASSAAARRLTADTLKTWRQDKLLDVATLLVSEVVTNAVLHAGSDIDLLLSPLAGGVRVEVGDSSAVLPGRRSYSEEATTGRGLELVELLATAWGTELRPHGKVVWFSLGQGDAAGENDQAFAGDPAAIVVPPHPEAAAPVPGRIVSLLGLPIALYRAMQQHNEALLRELTLLTLSTRGESADLGAQPSPPVTALLPLHSPEAEAQLAEATDAGRTTVDVRLPVPEGAREYGGEMLAALDHGDDLSRRGALLLPAALPEIRACRQWVLGEIIAQLDGAEPTAWAGTAYSGGEAGVVEVSPADILAHLGAAVVVGDDQNRIVAANAAAERMLGWRTDELVGKRITLIVPEHLREAHVIGYSRYLVTGRPRLIGQPTRVPARHRSGRQVPVELLLTVVPVPGGRQAFAAVLREVTDNADLEHTVTTASALAAASDLAALFGPSGHLSDLEGSAQAVLATIARPLGCAVGLLWRRDADTVTLRTVAGWDDGSPGGRAFRAASTRRTFRGAAGIPGRVWQSALPAWIPDVVADPNFPRASLAMEHGLRSAIAFPVVVGGHVWGVIEFFSSQVLDADADVLAVLAAMGRQLGAYAQAQGPSRRRGGGRR